MFGGFSYDFDGSVVLLFKIVPDFPRQIGHINISSPSIFVSQTRKEEHPAKNIGYFVIPLPRKALNRTLGPGVKGKIWPRKKLWVYFFVKWDPLK